MREHRGGWVVKLSGLVLGFCLFSVGVASAATAADYYNAGLGLYQKGQFEQAHKYFAAAEQVDPSDYRAFQADGFCLYRMGQTGEAVAACDKSLSLHPDNPQLKAFTDKIRGSSALPPLPDSPSVAPKPSEPSRPAGRNNDLYLNPAGLLFGLGGIGFEHGLASGRKSWTVEASYASHSFSGESITLMGLGGSFRFWLGDKPPLHGWFVGPNVGYLNIKWKYDSAYYDYTTYPYYFTTSTATSASFFYFGGVVGRQWISDGGILFNLGLTVDYMVGGFKEQPGQPGFKYSGFFPGIMLNLGYAF